VLISAVGGGTRGPGHGPIIEPIPCNLADRAIATPWSTSQCGAYPTYVALHHKTKWFSGTL